VDKACKKGQLFANLAQNVVIVDTLDTASMVNFYWLVNRAHQRHPRKGNSNVKIVKQRLFGHLTILLIVESVYDVNVANEEQRATRRKMADRLFVHSATTVIVFNGKLNKFWKH
jgi:hypothetical protein